MFIVDEQIRLLSDIRWIVQNRLLNNHARDAGDFGIRDCFVEYSVFVDFSQRFVEASIEYLNQLLAGESVRF